MLLKKMIGMAVFGSLALCAQESNLLGNGDFEEGLYGWGVPEWTLRGKTFSIDETASQEVRGTRSLRMDLARGVNSALFMEEPFELPEGVRNYVFSCWLKKASDGKSRAFINVRITFSAQGKKNVVQGFRIPYNDLKTEWTRFQKEFTLPDAFSTGSVSLLISGVDENATAWLDNIQLTGKK